MRSFLLLWLVITSWPAFAQSDFNNELSKLLNKIPDVPVDQRLAHSIRSCVQAKWTVAGNARQWPAVKLRLQFKEDGSLSSLTVQEPKKDPAFQSATKTAMDAIYACAPFKFPPEHYAIWKDVVLNFDPKDVISAPTQPRTKAQPNPLADFHRAVNDVVRNPARGFVTNKAGDVRVKFTLGMDGKPETIEVLQSSGDSLIDLHAQNIINTAKFPSPPKDTPLNQRTFAITISYVPKGTSAVRSIEIRPSTERDARAADPQVIAAITQRLQSCVESKWELVDDARAFTPVKLQVTYKRDGSLSDTPQILEPEDTPNFKMTAHSAIAAVYGCAPLSLPAEHYDVWKSIVLNLDPLKAIRLHGPTFIRPAGITRSSENDDFGRQVLIALTKALPRFPKTVKVGVSVQLSKTGAIEGLKLVRSSGNKDNDEALMTAVPKTAFPTPPSDSTELDRSFSVFYSNQQPLVLR